ncbi:MAG: DUF2937 family protein [Inquilinus sp.]|nr:DUF2937 family protein [Inquilinus sp.]
MVPQTVTLAGDARSGKEVPLLQYLLRKGAGLVAIGMIAAGALGTSQLSTFMQHYQQNLAGRLAEARRDMAGIAERAGEAGLPIYAYLDEFRRATNPIFVREGVWLQAKINRATTLETNLQALRGADTVTRPYVFVSRFDREIAEETWIDFKPAVPLDATSLIYAAIGGVLGLLAYLPIAGLAGIPGRLAERRSSATARSRLAARMHGE